MPSLPNSACALNTFWRVRNCLSFIFCHLLTAAKRSSEPQARVHVFLISVSFDNGSTTRVTYIPWRGCHGGPIEMKLTAILAATLIAASPLALSPAIAAPKGEPSAKSQSVHKQVRHRAHQRSIRHLPSTPRSSAYRNHPWPDPSFDRSGRPYRPNIYSPCTVDLGYGRFASCDSSND